MAPAWGGTRISQITADFTDYSLLSQSVLLLFKSLQSREEFNRAGSSRQVAKAAKKYITAVLGGLCAFARGSRTAMGGCGSTARRDLRADRVTGFP